MSYTQYRWIDKLQTIVNFYNNRFHITIGMTPSQARLPENKQLVLKEVSGFSDFNNRNLNLKPKY